MPKISQLPLYTDTNLDPNDVFPFTDVSDISETSSGKTKKVSFSKILSSIGNLLNSVPTVIQNSIQNSISNRVINDGNASRIRVLTQSEFDSIATKDPNTVYFIRSNI